MGKTTCRKFCRTRVFAVKLGIISCFIYGTYFILYLLSDDSNVELKSPLKRLIINSVLRKQTKTTGPEECPVPRFNSSLPQPHDGCQRLTPVKRSCQLANKLFFSSPPDTCQHQLKTEICKIIESDGKLNVDCSDRICAEQKVSLGEINRKSGELEWQDFPSTKNLETHLRKVLSSKTDNYGFYFIRCAINVDEIKEEVADEVINSNIGMEDEYIMVDVVAQQLLLIPPFVKKTLKSHNHINVNILFIDSVSHSHFLRSLPKTLQTLRELHGTSVFNYELFQSLKGRTYENLQALFSGELYDVEKPFGLQDMPPSPVHLGRLFAGFKTQGFETMYTEDLCWQWEWGLVKNLLAYMPGDDVEKRWKIFTKSLKKAGIDRIDMTLASCEILTDNQHHDPFHGPAAICYNGQYQHHYILEYLGKRQEQLKKNNKPFFHNTLLNVGHDDYGRRIQTLDYDLAEYLKMASKLRNTLTFILSDHGNTYGEYIKQNEEARVEMFHSVLFMLVPPGVAETLGPTRLNSLRINQQRLVSILDLHYALRFLSETKLGNLDEKHKKYFIKPDGIFSEIPSNRSCSDIPRIEPNVCICQDFEKVASKDERYTLLAEFALGTINNAIQEQYRKSNPDTKRGFGSCQRLVAHHFGNIKQRTNKFVFLRMAIMK
ncbi:uncharacterized protein [Antedon mediterranea]|uniref:uncharacterized protein isoform X2 n=1 Tax=Antedon mediterranea TaxID=105859 RepID=UPI003AF6813C